MVLGVPGPCCTHLPEVPGCGGDVVPGAHVDEPLLGQHVFTALVLFLQVHCIVCGESKGWGTGTGHQGLGLLLSKKAAQEFPLSLTRADGKSSVGLCFPFLFFSDFSFTFLPFVSHSGFFPQGWEPPWLRSKWWELGVLTAIRTCAGSLLETTPLTGKAFRNKTHTSTASALSTALGEQSFLAALISRASTKHQDSGNWSLSQGQHGGAQGCSWGRGRM